MTRELFLPAAAALACLALVACGRDPAVNAEGDAGPIPPCTSLRRVEGAQHRPLILVVADTLRRDRLGAYGGPARTPHFDGFADDNLLFTRATTQSPWTKPAMATLFTGLYPTQHGVTDHPDLRHHGVTADDETALASDALDDEANTLAEALADAGYRTGAFVSNPWLRESFGFAQGFQTYEDSFSNNATPGSVVTRAGLAWLRTLPEDGRPWFLYLHYMDPHAPYEPIDLARMREHLEAVRGDDRPLPPEAEAWIGLQARAPDGRQWVRHGVPPTLALLELVYDQGVESFDAALGSLLDGLQEMPGAAEAAIVVMADHGEALLHRGWHGHGKGLYEDEVAVPMAARLPGVEGPSTVACPVGLVDLRRTFCDYLGVECGGADQGASLLSNRDPRYVVTEGVPAKPSNRAVRNARYKLILQPDGGPENATGAAARWRALYDLLRDPGEAHDLLAEDPSPEVEAIAEQLSAAHATAVPALAVTPAERRVIMDDETRERLESLGYLTPSTKPSSPDARSDDTPP